MFKVPKKKKKKVLLIREKGNDLKKRPRFMQHWNIQKMVPRKKVNKKILCMWHGEDCTLKALTKGLS